MRWWSCLLVILCWWAALSPLEAATAEPAGIGVSVDLLAADDPAVRKHAIADLGASADPRALAILTDFEAGNLASWKGHCVVTGEPQADGAIPLRDPLTRLPCGVAPPDAVTALSPTRRERLLCREAMIQLRLGDPDPAERQSAYLKVGDTGDPAWLPALRKALAREQDPHLRSVAAESEDLLDLALPAAADAPVRLAAIHRLAERGSSRARQPLLDLMGSHQAGAPKEAAAAAVVAIDRWQRVVRGVGDLFAGVSLGSILVLMALGLSIVFGLMGVINMAHGELMMVGAYATYLTQQAFSHFAPGMQGGFFLCAIPISFAATAVVGLLIEWSIVRHLYGRPLETLLATWGVSLVLIQIVRLTFGDNIAVNSPRWLQGGLILANDIVLPSNRIFIIVFCIGCIVGLFLLISRTRLGLLLRSTTQNRRMAAALGVSTRRIDAVTFALGSGLAGLAGCALTQIGGVTPDMGQNYIVDAFMVVVVGGVGKLAGAVVAGLSIGCLTKCLEPFVESVWAKVLILGAVILLLQWRPAGLFQSKGRLVDA